MSDGICRTYNSPDCDGSLCDLADGDYDTHKQCSSNLVWGIDNFYKFYPHVPNRFIMYSASKRSLEHLLF